MESPNNYVTYLTAFVKALNDDDTVAKLLHVLAISFNSAYF